MPTDIRTNLPNPAPRASHRSDRYFDSSTLTRDLGRRTARGGIVTLGGQGARFLLQMASTVVLARLLTPEDFGLIGMVTVFVNFVGLFKDFGLSQATVQRPQITRQQVSNLFWINVVVSLLLGLLMGSLAPSVAWFYGRDELVLVTTVLGGMVALQGFGLQHRALMMRTMEFGKLAVIGVVAQAFAALIGIAMALLDYGYWALVGVSITNALIETALCVTVTCWSPGRFRRGVGTLPYLTYGGNLFGFNLVNFFARNADGVLIGRVLGAEPLGLYNVAYRLLLLPMQHVNGPLKAPFLSALSRLQHQPQRYRTAYIRGLKATAMLTIPIVVFCGTFPELLIKVVLGDQWLGAASIFLALLPFAFLSATNVATGWVYGSLGHTARQFRFAIVNSVVMLAGIAIGMYWGPIGVAIGVSSAALLLRLPGVLYCFRGTPLLLRDYLGPQVAPTMMAIGAIAAPLGTATYFPSLRQLPDSVYLSLMLAIFSVCFLTIALLDHGPNSAIKLFKNIKI